jgi:hypothetical protein
MSQSGHSQSLETAQFAELDWDLSGEVVVRQLQQLQTAQTSQTGGQGAGQLAEGTITAGEKGPKVQQTE